MSKEDHWSSWLKNAEVLKDSCDCRFFAAIQVDARGLEPFKPLLDRLAQVGGEYWTYSLDDGRTSVSTANRLRHLVVGENLVTDYCTSNPSVTHMLFVAADCCAPDDVFPKLLEMNHPITAPNITTYCLSGTPICQYPFPVISGMASAACIFVQRKVFEVLRWRWVNGVLTDDPCYWIDAKQLMGIDTYIRMDIEATHWPKHVPPLEDRGNDLRVVR